MGLVIRGVSTSWRAALGWAVFGMVALGMAAGCGQGSAERDEPLVIYAAASLRDVVTEVVAKFEAYQDVRIELNFAGSNTLAQQIRAAPRADIFLSADRLWVEDLAGEGLLLAQSLRPFLANRMVVVGHRDAESQVSGLSDLVDEGFRFLALADPRGVPAGRYARQYLEQVLAPNGVTVWSTLESRLAPSLDVRAALALVESDPEILGMVYKTDAMSSPEVRVLHELPARPGIEIQYWAALVASGEPVDIGGLFVDFLSGSEAQAIAAAHGFVPLPETDV